MTIMPSVSKTSVSKEPMKSKPSLRLLLAASSTLLAISSATAQTTYTWANSNVTGSPASPLDWFTGGPNTQGTWIGGDPVGGNLNTIQFFQGTTTALTNTDTPSTQTVNLNNGGSAFELGTLTLSGLASATTSANLTMTLSGDALNFSAATGTINLNALNATRTITYNVNNNIELGTASGGSVLTLTGNGTSAFNFGGIISELQSGGGSLIKSGTSTVNLTGANTYTGTTTLNGGVLNLSGTSGSISASTGIILNGGGITLTNSDSTQGAVNRVSDTADITSNGGTFTYTNTSGNTLVYAETLGEVALASGQTNFVLTNNMAGTGNSQTLALTDLTRTGTTSTITFSAATTGPNATTNIINNLGFGGSATPAEQIIGPWATTGTAANVQNKWAVYDGSGNIVADSIADTAFASWTNSTTSAWSYNTGSSDTINTTYQAAAVRYYGATSTLTLGTGNLETYGLMFTGNNTKTVASTGGALTTPTGGGNLFLMAGNAGTQTISAPINDNGGAVTVVVGNSTGRTLSLSSTASNYSGGTVINSGILNITNNAHLGAASGGITLNGGQLKITSSNVSSARDVIVGPAGGSIAVNGNNNFTTTGILSGSGPLTFGPVTGAGGQALNFLSTANTFTGAIFVPTNAPTISFNSLPDSPNNIVFNGAQGGTFVWGAGAIAPLVLNQRSFEFRQTASGQTLTITNSSPLPGAAITVNTGLLVTGTGSANLVLGGANTGTNTFAGNIGDGPSGTTSVRATSSFWTLSGTNTYSGITGPDNVTLTIRGKNALPSASLISFDSTNGSAGGGGGRLNLFMDDAGTVNLGNQINVRTVQTSGSVTAQWTVNAGNNGGATTGSTLVLGKMNFASIADYRAGGYILNVTGSNGYGLRIGDVDLAPNVGSGGGTGSGSFQPGQGFNPTTAPLTITGTVRQNAASVASGAFTSQLVLWGTNTGNSISGNIMNPADFPGNANAKALNLVKGSSGTWTLSGNNSYTGGTTITTGQLVFDGANALPTTGTVAVGANGHLSLADGVARSQTVSALTLANGASLSFDWTGTGTGDQLTSTADITPTAGSNIPVNVIPSGTPGGSVTLLTGGAGSTLSSSNFYLANATNYSATLSTPTADTLVLNNYSTQPALTTIYWQGNKLAGAATAGVDNAWTLSNGTVSNWSSTTTAYTATPLTPGATSNVIFANGQVGKTQQSTILGSDVTINSLVIDDSTAVTIAGANGAALTLMSSLSTAGLVDGTPGSAITVTSTANATTTISSRVNLGSNQTWNVASGRTLDVTGEVAGNFSFTKADAGTVILRGTNTYTGDTTISAGILRIGNNTAGTLGGGNYAGNIVNNGTLQIWSSTAQTLSGVISGPGALAKAYGGTLTLSGANTYTGKTLLQPQTTAGFTLIVSSFNSVVGGTASSSLGAPTTVENGTIEFGSGSAQAGVNITYTGPGETTDRILNFNMNGTGATKTLDASGSGLLKFTSTFTKTGSNTNDVTLQGAGNGEIVGGLDFVFRNFTKAGTGTWTLGGPVGHTGTTTISGGSLELNSGATIGGGTYSNTITFSNSSTLRYNSTASQTLGGVISGAGSIVKDNTGTLTLSNVNTYTGATTVNAGTLIVGVAGVGSTAAGSAVTVASGGTLGGTGTVNGAITVTGSIAPGNSGIGILNSGAVTWNGNAISSAATDWKFNLGDTDTADKLAITGNFTKGTGSAFWFDFLGSAFTGTFDLVTWSGSTNFSAGDFEYTNLGGGYTGSFTISGSTLQFIAIPEPSTALGGLLLTAGLFRRRRR